jgi:hypothetical protein
VWMLVSKNDNYIMQMLILLITASTSTLKENKHKTSSKTRKTITSKRERLIYSTKNGIL